MNETKTPKKGKAIRIDYLYNNQPSVLTYETDELMTILKNEIVYKSHLRNNPFGDICVTEHAALRWSERVSSTISNKKDIELYMNESAILGRIEYLHNNFGLLNDDIIFHYFTGEYGCKISSFYGSLKELPALASIDKLYQYIDTKNDGIHLSVREETVNTKKIWPLPIFNIRYTGNNGPYMFEIYESSNGERVCLHACKNGVRRCWRLHDPNVKLSKSTITAIKIFNGTHGFIR